MSKSKIKFKIKDFNYEKINFILMITPTILGLIMIGWFVLNVVYRWKEKQMIKKVIPEHIKVSGWKVFKDFKKSILDSGIYSKMRTGDLVNLRTASLFKDSIRYITSDFVIASRGLHGVEVHNTSVYKFDNYITLVGFLKDSKYKFYLKDVDYVGGKWEVECIVQENKSGNREYLINKIIENGKMVWNS